MKTYKLKQTSKQGGSGEEESYLAPAPPLNGKIYAIDQHPDTNTVAVVKGSTPHDMIVEQTKGDLDLTELIKWLYENATAQDQILVEAGNGCFDLCTRLAEKNLSCCVLESTWIGGQASKYVDSDKLAAVRIARVYLQGNAKAVWTPDEKSIQRREVLHFYDISVKKRTKAINTLKSYLTKHGVRPGKKDIRTIKNQEMLRRDYTWSEFETHLLELYIKQLNEACTQVKDIEQMMLKDLSQTPDMLKLMGLMGIGKINAFALIAIIGDITRFANPKKLVSYLGLNPSQKTSGKGKSIKIGVGKRGRRDMRALIIQAAQAVLRIKDNPLGKWGLKLLLRKGHRNIAVAAVARKLVTQVWHLLSGNKPELLESTKARQLKFKRFLCELGAETRATLNLPKTIDQAVEYFDQLISNHLTKLSQKAIDQ